MIYLDHKLCDLCFTCCIHESDRSIWTSMSSSAWPHWIATTLTKYFFWLLSSQYISVVLSIYLASFIVFFLVIFTIWCDLLFDLVFPKYVLHVSSCLSLFFWWYLFIPVRFITTCYEFIYSFWNAHDRNSKFSSIYHGSGNYHGPNILLHVLVFGLIFDNFAAFFAGFRVLCWTCHLMKIGEFASPTMKFTASLKKKHGKLIAHAVAIDR